jgi:hypothetical protein
MPATPIDLRDHTASLPEAASHPATPSPNRSEP